MANELQSLSVLFQNRLFRIPDYQRGYAWKHEQLADFWDDLLNLHEGRYHYTGLLSLTKVDGNAHLLSIVHMLRYTRRLFCSMSSNRQHVQRLKALLAVRRLPLRRSRCLL